MKVSAAAVFALLLLNLLSAYQLNKTRDQLLSSYYSDVDSKIPNGLRALVGDEKINVNIGGRTIGIETRSGRLYSFEYAPLKNPGIVITVSDEAADRIGRKEMGVMAAIDSRLITIRTTNFFSMLKVEALKRVYVASGMDKKLMEYDDGNYNAVYVQKLKVGG